MQKKQNSRTYLVTQALPYANGDIHLGHLVEAVQTDIFVRYHRMAGDRVLFPGADDTHGTPIELSALRKNITPEALIAAAWDSHVADYKGFSIDFDIFYTTNSPENKHYAESIFASLQKNNLIVEKEISQFYCEHDKRFLPDRFVVGTCPKCSARDQYGDVCEACGTTYEPADLSDPKCIICKNPPIQKTSKHFFVELGKKEEFLREFVYDRDVLRTDMKNFVGNWITQGLRQWCISRDGPYFGFLIPGTTDKYFYVWLDAPIGYLSSTEKWCADHNEDIDTFWGKESQTQIVHFIGKDIVYFHALFWPVMLEAANKKLPNKINVHGFLTVNGEKMSKTRGTFVLAKDYRAKINHPQAAEYLRFFYASKLGDSAQDIDLSADEFALKVNTILANTIGNLHHRTFIFCERSFDSYIPDAPWDQTICALVEKTAHEIIAAYEAIEYKTVVEKIQYLGSIGNKYYQDNAPWESVKTDPSRAAAVMVTCANLVKALVVFLKPITPALAAVVEKQLGLTFTLQDYAFSLRNVKVAPAQKLATPIEAALLKELFVPPTSVDQPAIVPIKPTIPFDVFGSVDLRLGTVVQAERIKKSDKLLKLMVDLGEITPRQIVAGLGKHFKPEALLGRQVVVAANLAPAKLMGEVSNGMVLAVKEGEKLTLLGVGESLSNGCVVS